MTKKKKTETPVDEMPMDDPYQDVRGCPVPDNPTDLIYRLNDFYNKNPDYETSVIMISTLMRLAYQEMNKFICRPHTQVTTVYFDNDAPNAAIIR